MKGYQSNCEALDSYQNVLDECLPSPGFFLPLGKSIEMDRASRPTVWFALFFLRPNRKLAVRVPVEDILNVNADQVGVVSLVFRLVHKAIEAAGLGIP